MKIALASLTLCACATVPPPPPPDAATLPSTAVLADMDWRKAGDEAFDDLRAYLQTPTVNPPGNERPGAELLQQLLAKDGIESTIWSVGDAPADGSPNPRATLVARLKARGTPAAGPLCLVSHIDVVTAEDARWPKGAGPFSGAVVRDEKTGDDLLYGRGALDMKGLGLLEVDVLRWLKRLDVKLDRDVIVLAVADEEVASKGMIDAIERHWDELGCSHAINEGGLGVESALFEGQTAFTISVGEKGVLWLRVIAEGPPGHGSTPVEGRAPGKLLEAMKRIASRKDHPHVHPALYELLASAGREEGGVNGFILERPVLVDALVVSTLLEKPLTRAIITNTVNLTGFSGALSPNVVPSEVAAQYDLRLLPGTTAEEALDEVKKLVGDIPGIRYEIIDQRAAAVSEWDDPLYRALARHVVEVAKRDGIPRAIVGPVISPGFTDSILLRAKGVKAYGFVPFVVTAEDAGTMHGDGERVSRRNVRRGLETLLRAVIDVSSRANDRGPSAE